ncbi:SRPBCC family protein [Streptomyces malaysiense]|uniref:Cyclase n=1 Tax=Streptomyces malaysiense TaxID=1428626 RepID=A0A1J4Q6U6_9ACTN|nr:SRPBCC family protein [Streptomyces malaysiense]OIK28705.1 hypothetical protein VT52_004950 [Streptomyces malaysiense]
MGTTVSHTLEIASPPERLLSTLRDIATYPQWQQDVESAEVVESDESARPLRARLVLSAIGMRVTQVLAFEHTERQLVWRLVEGQEDAPISRNDAVFQLARTADGNTELKVRQDLEFRLKLPQSLARRIVERRSTAMLRQLKSAVEKARP